MFTKILSKGIIKENPIFTQAIALCPVLAVTTAVYNGIGMGLATLAVLVMACLAISLLRKLIPETVRIPCFIVIVATFTTVVQFLIEAYIPVLHEALGIFIPLIVVNCLVLARAEAVASKKGLLETLVDAIGMGLGFTLALVIISIVRELIGVGSVFGVMIIPEEIPRAIIMILPPGGFFALGFLMAGATVVKRKINNARLRAAIRRGNA